MPLPPSKATILVVDDEVPLRSILARQLRSEGYNVLEAGYGLQALQVARSSPEPIDLVLSDIVMPGMIGTELAQRLMAEHPGVQVVLMSAHAVDELSRPDRRHNVAVLRKPFEGSQVLAIVQLLLSTTPPHAEADPSPDPVVS
jgi:two-component system, cell cycle sensor histidine kinase and response regulator CckA